MAPENANRAFSGGFATTDTNSNPKPRNGAEQVREVREQLRKEHSVT